MSTPLVEICVDGADGLAAAVAGGADRIELCAALDLGGLTPSPGLLRLAAAAPIPVRAMIRPRGGDFVYSAADLDAMIADVDAVRAAGLSGVVIGASRPGGALDASALERLADAAAGLSVTVHRAFDLVPDVGEAAAVVAAVGADTVLTSGGAPSAAAGLDRLVATVAAARGRFAVMPGAGVTAATVAAILDALGPAAAAVHASASTPAAADDPAAAALGFSTRRPRTDPAAVAALKAAVVAWSAARAR